MLTGDEGSGGGGGRGGREGHPSGPGSLRDGPPSPQPQVQNSVLTPRGSQERPAPVLPRWTLRGLTAGPLPPSVMNVPAPRRQAGHPGSDQQVRVEVLLKAVALSTQNGPHLRGDRGELVGGSHSSVGWGLGDQQGGMQPVGDRGLESSGAAVNTPPLPLRSPYST